MTNADKIRQMSDEELAKLLRHSCPLATTCPDLLKPKMPKSCYECWIDWLKKEVKENA